MDGGELYIPLVGGGAAYKTGGWWGSIDHRWVVGQHIPLVGGKEHIAQELLC